jgi:ribosomal protein S18 acetylase RimI-like enzyme
VTAAPINLRRLGAEDASAYREIRLEALADSPHNFSSTLENEQDQPLDHFATRLADDFVLGAFSGPHLVGVAGFYVQPRPKHRHKGMLWGMYVRPDYRAAGIGRKLVEAIVAHARQRVELLQLFVVSDNAPARRLYTSLGFIEYGIERHATKYRGQYHDDVLMALPLMVDSGPEASCAPTQEISAEEVSA